VRLPGPSGSTPHLTARASTRNKPRPGLAQARTPPRTGGRTAPPKVSLTKLPRLYNHGAARLVQNGGNWRDAVRIAVDG